MTLLIKDPRHSDRVTASELAARYGHTPNRIRRRYWSGLRGERLVETVEAARARAAKEAGRTRSSDPVYAETMRQAYRRADEQISA